MKTASPQLFPYPALVGLVLLIALPNFFSFETDGLILSVLAVTTGAVAGIWLLRPYHTVEKWGLICIGIFFVSVASLFFSRVQYFTLVDIVWCWIAVLIYTVMSSWSNLPGYLSRLSWIILGSQSVLTLSGLWSFLSTGQRATGFSLNANGLGGILVFGLGLGMVGLLQQKRRKRLFMMTLVMLICWMTTISLTAFLAAIPAIVLFGWWFRQSIPWRTIIIVTAVSSVALAYTWFIWKPQKLVSLMTQQHITFSFTQRLEFDRVALRMWQAKPMTGWGLGSYRQTFPRFTTQFSEQPLYAHNVYFQVLAETGIFGGLGWLITILYIGRRGLQKIRKLIGDEQRLAQGMFLGWLAFTVHAALDFSWHFPAGLVCWIAISAFFLYQNEKGYRPRTRLETVVIGILTLAILILGVINVFATQASDQAGMKANTLKDDETISQYGRAIRLRPSTVDIQELARAYWLRRKEGDLLRGQKILQQALRHNQDNYFLHNALGHNYQAQGKIELALMEYQTAYNLDPWFHPQFVIDPARLLIAEGRKSDARALLQQARDRYSTKNINNPTVVELIPVLQQLEQQAQ